jgi:diguanylate cyclase (GGDEF)-like protein
VSETIQGPTAETDPLGLSVTTGPRIVLAEDDDTVRLILSSVLTEAGYQVAEAADGLEALRRLRESRPALVILDVAMPGANGFEVCRIFRAEAGPDGPPVLILTGQEGEEAVTRAFEVGATDFANKPIAPALLVHRVRFLLRNHEALEALRRSEAGLENAQRLASLGSWEWEFRTGVCSYSREAMAILELSAEDGGLWFGEFQDRVIPGDRAVFRFTVEMTRSGGAPTDLRHRIVRSNGDIRHVHTRAELARDAKGKPVSVIGTVQDITDRVQAQEKIVHLSRFDALTDLPNRAFALDSMEFLLADAARRNRRAAVLLVDLHRFNEINDTRGPRIGDAVLAAVGNRLRNIVRRNDAVARISADPDAKPMLARVGGDEFMVALGGLERGESAALIAQRLLESFQVPFRVAEQDISLSAAIGISVYPDDGATVEELIVRAEQALGQAKQADTNWFEFFDQDLGRAAAARRDLTIAVRRAVEREEFTLFYQPIVDTRGRLTGSEGLLRWFQHDGTLIPPGVIIPILEETALLTKVVEWTLRTGARQLKEWDDRGLAALKLSVNLAPHQLANADLAAHLSTIVRAEGLPPTRFTLEVTEGALVQHPEAGAVLERLRQAGFRIALDDFGTGYSALSYLRKFPIDTLKIDRSFVHDLPDDARQSAIFRAIISLARELDMEPLAEGVETERQREYLVGAGCRAMQGFLFGRALSPESFAQLLASSRV